MENNKILRWVLITMGLFIFINFYMCCYNMHNLNQHIEKHEVVKEITVPTVIQVDMSYKLPMDTSIIKVENHKKQQ